MISEAIHVLEDAYKDAGYITYDALPERIFPPCVVIKAGDPFISEVESFGGAIVNFEVICVLETQPYTQAQHALFKEVPRLVQIARAADFDVTEISAPIEVQPANQRFPAIRLEISKEIEIF